MRLYSYLLGAVIAGTAVAAVGQEVPSMEETYAARQMPTWFNEAKLGIFVVWGPYSVPGFAKKDNYAEWYLKTYDSPQRLGNQETVEFHNKASA